jgi:hypothetical protein
MLKMPYRYSGNAADATALASSAWAAKTAGVVPSMAACTASGAAMAACSVR